MKKTIMLSVMLSIAVYSSHAQLTKLIRTDHSFDDSLSKIVVGFKTNFNLIQGKQLTAQGLVDVYQSRIGLPGASHCVIQRYHSQEDSAASWQAVMYTGESYDEAVKVYKNTYKQLKKSKLNVGDAKPLAFIGEMEVPTESLRFTVTPLRLTTTDKLYKHFYAEVEITNSYVGWEVHLNLHSKKNDEEKY